MTDNAIELHIAEHGLVSTIETLIASPKTLGTTEADAAYRLRIIASILTVPNETTASIVHLTDALDRLRH